MTVGMYPLTQVYQCDADKKSGDRTLAVVLGINNTFTFAMIFIAIAGVCLFRLLLAYFQLWLAIGVLFYISMLLLSVYRWRNSFDPNQVEQNFRKLHSLAYSNSFFFLLFTLIQLSGLHEYLNWNW
jgi:1,4-dihydroxy-2-naphthoate octaprenyltransferase